MPSKDLEKKLPLISEDEFFSEPKDTYNPDPNFKWHESWPDDMDERLEKWFRTPFNKEYDKGAD